MLGNWGITPCEQRGQNRMPAKDVVTLKSMHFSSEFPTV
jgi:hypothetical protein